ncbi:hypothetical protein EN836_26385 [Mesorhizobium sp. M1C.F.Ca.ET.193.01.1.1]|uniref:hypothetical protein n=1 Tax=unclassified Mesorhizobium TaxID=325217 RepID=UPI000FD21330|nr:MULTISPECIES: hypothetical protein [unclassified Mesorhizobium]TGS93999.1 hypothetical protein EN820_47050 [bacterium M00.F.Ca.ET.177.01.1.1]TGQ51068.1 hypothetical protein EN853_26380 [Mesorhizobium sp. M1C.F.Ca.ET.210.01.1.1]TGQ66499.1 hypothetical protein EN855_026390 [Mesorhizobium sp. M1C.F.Ca.ET.212.01.1.1]TGR00895.1 hypothetical protein EN847_26380 [Mesorhizobium sp. M1C.F.Ca.ET.204.01.1.1]TGR21170.1 hypothetical protein EN839_26380 [Mesorhizobium sp. M1C.F.Ca.ET.196.01.1.1]
MASRMVGGAALGAALFISGAALAEDALKLTELSPNGADACFGRVYDVAHLKAHSHQKVARIFFYYGHDPVSRPNEEPSTLGDAAYNGFLTTTVRGAKKPEWAAGWCNKEDPGDKASGIHCGMECDRTLASLKVDDKGRLILSDLQPDVYLDAGAEEDLGKAKYNEQALGSEDDNFRLDPMPASTCKAEFARIDPIDPALGAPLRERLKPDQSFCYGRDYDAEHLKSHPDQVTQSIRVFRGPIELASFAASGDAANWPDGADIAVSVTTRQKGAKVTQTYSCQGEADQWRCSASSKMSDFACDISQKEIFLKRGASATMMLANPNSALAIVDLCSKAAGGKTKSDDKIYRLNPMPQSACAP